MEQSGPVMHTEYITDLLNSGYKNTANWILSDGLIEAEYLYADARCMSRDHPLCIDCIHHLVIKAECGLGMPEGKASGGVWAKDCAYFWEKKI